MRWWWWREKIPHQLGCGRTGFSRGRSPSLTGWRLRTSAWRSRAGGSNLRRLAACMRQKPDDVTSIIPPGLRAVPRFEVGTFLSPDSTSKRPLSMRTTSLMQPCCRCPILAAIDATCTSRLAVRISDRIRTTALKVRSCLYSCRLCPVGLPLGVNRTPFRLPQAHLLSPLNLCPIQCRYINSPELMAAVPLPSESERSRTQWDLP